MPHDATILGLDGYEIKDIRWEGGQMLITARYTGPAQCPHCGSARLRKKDRLRRQPRHESWGLRTSRLQLEVLKFQCRGCARYFNQRLPGLQPRRRATEPFRRQIYSQHLEGMCRKTLAERQRIGTATVERWFQDFLGLKLAERQAEPCPQILGIDEHFFTRKQGYATTLCDLKHHKVYDVVLGRSERALEGYFTALPGKAQVRVVCIDLSSPYRALVRKHFPRALIVADRFHVIRLINQQFLATWRKLDPLGSQNRGLLSLIRRHPQNLRPDQQQRLNRYWLEHPEVRPVYDFKQRLCRLLLKKHCTARCCRRLIPLLLEHIQQLKYCGLDGLEQLGRTLGSWREEIARMWRFTRNNGITEGFHNKMEMISRRAFGFRNFENYRLRVRVLCA
jgi:transposase